jgi:hypothetical protein
VRAGRPQRLRQIHGVPPEERTDALADEGRLDKEMVEIDLGITQHDKVRDAGHRASNLSTINGVLLDGFGREE